MSIRLEGPTGSRSLEALASNYLASVGEARDPFTIRATEAFGTMYPLIGRESHTESTLLSLSWGAIVSTRWFARLLAELNLSLGAKDSPDLIVVAHRTGGHLRYDLVVLTPPETRLSPAVVAVPATLSEIEISLGVQNFQRDSGLLSAEDNARWRAGERPQRLAPESRALSIFNSTMVRDAIRTIPMGILFFHKPRTIGTSVPTPAMRVEPAAAVGTASTLGVIEPLGDGRLVATCCRHGISTDLQNSLKGAQVILTPLGGANGHRGTVVSDDVISDSCLVEFDPSKPPGHTGPSMPLRGQFVPPSDQVHFEGIASGATSTYVQGSDKALLSRQPTVQKRIYTNAVTSPGDSGAALRNNDGKIIGFCFERTALHEPIEYSSWIWADSVYQAHGIR